MVFALALLTLAAAGVCYGTWAYVEVTGIGDAHVNFTTTVAGVHSLQVKASASGFATAGFDIAASPQNYLTEAYADYGGCQRVSTPSLFAQTYCLLEVVATGAGATEKSYGWMTERGNSQLPTCSGS